MRVLERCNVDYNEDHCGSRLPVRDVWYFAPPALGAMELNKVTSLNRGMTAVFDSIPDLIGPACPWAAKYQRSGVFRE